MTRAADHSGPQSAIRVVIIFRQQSFYPPPCLLDKKFRANLCISGIRAQLGPITIHFQFHIPGFQSERSIPVRLSTKLTMAAVGLLPASAITAFLLQSPADVIADCAPGQCATPDGKCNSNGGCIASACDQMDQQCVMGSWSNCGCGGGGGS